MDADGPTHPISAAVIAEASRYLAIIDRVLAMDYLKPDLRRRVVRMQRRLIDAEMDGHHPERAIREPV